jgi:hypothetical protein
MRYINLIGETASGGWKMFRRFQNAFCLRDRVNDADGP